MAAHPLYNTWKKMRDRCHNPRATQYPYYGARGIGICERWDDFARFAADMGERPTGYTLDRIDPAVGYSPENCRWATKAEQNGNRSNTLRLALPNGETLNGAEAARRLGIDKSSIYRQRRRRPDRLLERLSR